MARPFSYPEVPTLLIGEGCFLEAPASQVRRKVALYSARNGKAFQMLSTEDGQQTYIQRLPDPRPQQAAS